MLNTRTVLKENDLYLVADGSYRVAGQEAGLYRRDTRFLSRYRWRLDGADPQPLLQEERYAFWLHEQAANANVGYTMRVGLRRDVQLGGGGLRDRLTFTRYSGEGPHTLSLELAADFADMFEVRGWPQPTGQRAVSVTPADHGVEFAYTALDGLRCRARVEVSPPATWTGERLEWTVEGERAEIEVRVYPLQGEETPPHPQAHGHALLALAAEYDALQARVGETLRLNDPLDERVLTQSVADLRSLTFTTAQGPFPAAGLPWFVAPFGRDSLIIALMVRRHLPDLAMTVARFLAAHQGQTYNRETLEEPGKIPHELRVGELTRLGRTPHRPYYATADATPLFVWLVGELCVPEDGGAANPDLARELRPCWEAALRWCLTDGDPDGDGFVEYTPDPGGIINAVWKDSADSTFNEHGVDASGHVAVVEVQGYAYAAYRAAARLYALLGEASLARGWEERATQLQARFQAAFWWPERGYYVHALGGDKRPLRVLVSNPAHALWTGIIPEEHAPAVARAALSPALWSGWGIRTLAEGQPRYNPVSYHNGSVWPHDTAAAALGLARYGLKAEARTVARALFDAARSAPDARLSELFAGFSREPGSAPVPYPAACHPQGWDAAIPLALGELLAH